MAHILEMNLNNIDLNWLIILILKKKIL